MGSPGSNSLLSNACGPRILHTLYEDGYAVDQLIIFSSAVAGRNRVAGFADIGPAARALGVPVCLPLSYTSRDPADLAAVSAMRLDLLLAIGWERLVPGEVLSVFRSSMFRDKLREIDKRYPSFVREHQKEIRTDTPV